MASNPEPSVSFFMELWLGFLTLMTTIILYFMHEKEKDVRAKWRKNEDDHKEIQRKSDADHKELWEQKVNTELFKAYLISNKEDKDEMNKKLEKMDKKLDIIVQGHYKHRADDAD